MNFSKVDEILKQLEDKRRVLNFIIDGQGIHGLPMKAVHYLTMERISELYNVEFQEVGIISCKHKNVSEIGYVQTLDGKEYDGFCDDCNHMVYGTIYWNKRKKPTGWKLKQ